MATYNELSDLTHETDSLKRGSEHFMAHLTDNYMTENKRAKLDVPPSKVVHIRNLPDTASEADVIALGIPFGKITNVLKIPPSKGRGNKSQAFLQMEDEEKASAMVSYYSALPPNVRGSNVYVQFSTHTELKTDPLKQSPVVTNLLTAAAIASTTGDMSSVYDFSGSNYQTQTQTAPSAAYMQPVSQQPAGMSNVLRVVVDNKLYPVSIDALNIIFSKYGAVVKIVICTKTNQFQVFVQYRDQSSASAAKTALDGQNIYNGCCTMKIGFSKFSDLNVKYNNEKSRDFSRPDLPSGEGQPQFDPNLGITPATSLLGLPALVAGGLGNPALSAGSALMAAAAAAVQGGLAGVPPMQSPTQEEMPPRRGGGFRDSCVLLVSQLNAEKIKCDDLFTLFGAYGDVMRVKILYNKPDTAMVQFAEPRHAEIARENLNNVPFQGKQLRVSTSKHNSVSMPKENSEGAHLTKDYSNSPIHRFRKYGSKNYQNIFPPSRTLHLSNIPSDHTEETLTALFASKTAALVSKFEFFSKDAGKDKRMALLEMETVEDAVQALVDLHDTSLGENNHLRVSFARKGISR